MRQVAWQPKRVIDGTVLKNARIRAGLSQRRLAARMNIGERTLQDWEKKGVPDGKDPLVMEVLGYWIDGGTKTGPPPLTEYSDVALLSELGRRLDEYKHGRDQIATETEAKAPPTEPKVHGTNTGRVLGRGGKDPNHDNVG
jgi:transcriptional regulator with XRE-family HTH domain